MSFVVSPIESWIAGDGNTVHIVEPSFELMRTIQRPEKQRLGLFKSKLKQYLWELGFLPRMLLGLNIILFRLEKFICCGPLIPDLPQR